MKKTIIYAALTVLFASCTIVRVTMGMPETQFTKLYKTAELVQFGKAGNVYRMLLYQNGRQSYKFFYFEDGKLIQMDEGTPRPDVVIQNTN